MKGTPQKKMEMGLVFYHAGKSFKNTMEANSGLNLKRGKGPLSISAFPINIPKRGGIQGGIQGGI